MKNQSVGNSLLSSARKLNNYLRNWAPLLQGGTGRAGFNWAAFFLSGLWLAYRKMYKVTLILFVIIIVETVLPAILCTWSTLGSQSIWFAGRRAASAFATALAEDKLVALTVRGSRDSLRANTFHNR